MQNVLSGGKLSAHNLASVGKIEGTLCIFLVSLIIGNANQ
jgi:hypothetical protein